MPGLIKFKYLQTKFHSSRRPSDPCTTPPSQPSHGVCVQANPIVVLNALGYIGFKVVSTCGDAEVNKNCSNTYIFPPGDNLEYSEIFLFNVTLFGCDSFTLDTSIVWSALIIVVAHSEVPRTSKYD